MRDDFGVGFGVERVALRLQLFAQFLEILDDAVVHDRDLVGRMRVRVHFVRLAMRRPAGVADAAVAFERLARQPLFQVLQLAFGAAAREVAAFQRRDAGRVIAAIFKALERLDDFLGDGLAPKYSDDPAHENRAPSSRNNAQLGFRRC